MKKRKKEKRDIPVILLAGLPEICSAVRAGPNTVKRWIKEEGFPAHKGKDGTYRADPEKIREWWNTRKPCQDSYDPPTT